MKKNNVIQTKTYAFAVKSVRLCKEIMKQEKEYILSKQLLRSATSIGANVEEAIGGQSRRDFFAKLTIAYKEARETHYWIRLMKDTEYILNDKADEMISDVEEILRIIGSIQRTIRNS